MHETQPKDESKNIEINEFDKGNINLINEEDYATRLLCEYKVKYTHKEDNKDGKTEEIKIKIKIPISKKCNELDDFVVFVGEDNRKLRWTADSFESNKNTILQYLMELNNEVNQFNNTKKIQNFVMHYA